MEVTSERIQESDRSDVPRESGQRVRIAHVQLLPLLSGVQRVSVDELLRLDRSVYDPHLICQSPGPLTELLQREAIPCLFAPHLVRPVAPWHDAIALWELYRLFRAHRFQIVHTHSSKPGVLGRIAAKAAGVPRVLHTVHGFAFPASRSRVQKAVFAAMERVGGWCSDAVVFVKEDDRRLGRRVLGIPAERLHLLRNGVDLERFRPLGRARRAAVRRRVFGAGGETVMVGMVARLDRQKNPLCFVRAARLALAAGARARFVLIGDGELRRDVEAEIARLGCAEQVHVLGWRSDVAELLGALDLFVLTSDWEGLPLVILEALACGLPVVASDIPGNRDAVSDGVDGLLAPRDDAPAFARRIVELAGSKMMRREFGSSGRRKVEAEFDVGARCRQMVELYRRLLPHPPSPDLPADADVRSSDVDSTAAPANYV